MGPFGTSRVIVSGGAARLNFLRISPSDTSIMYTGSPAGGLWKSVDGGKNWTTNTDQLSVLGCSDLAIHPQNPNIMYLATGDGDGNGSQLYTPSVGVLKTTNRGQTWDTTHLKWNSSLVRVIYKLIINPSNPNIIIAATSNGLYRTKNGGQFWTNVKPGYFTNIEYKPGSSKTLYAVNGYKGTANFSAGGIFYISNDSGATFDSTGVGVGLPSYTLTARLAIAVTAADSNLIYLIAVKPTTNDFYGFYASTNGGATFTLRSNSPNILGLGGAQAHYNLAIAVSPVNKNKIFVGATNGFMSFDGGVNWNWHTDYTNSGGPYVHPDYHDIQFMPGSDSSYFSVNDGGLWRTRDAGATWNPTNDGMQISQMYNLCTSQQNPNIIYTGHQDMGFQRHDNGLWKLWYFYGDGMENQIDYNNDSIRYSTIQFGNIFKTTKAGAPNIEIVKINSTGVHAKGNWQSPFVMNPKKSTTLLVGKAQVYRSYNGGTSWSAIGNITTGTGNIVSNCVCPY